MRIILIIVFWAGVLTACTAEDAGIAVSIGPTTIPRGDAMGDRDITINNGLFAIAFAVDTAPPWGVARGGIVDIAIVRDGVPGYDIASLADFMPNNWSSWPTTYQRISIEKQTADEVIIKTLRDWGDVALETDFHIRNLDSKIHIVTRMTNKGDASLAGLLSGYVVWPDGGNLIGKRVVSSGTDEHNGGWTAAYDEHWMLGLHAPFAERAANIGRDRYTLHDLPPGETASFEAWLQIESGGSLAPMVQTEIDFGRLASGRISGRVESDDGSTVARPAVIISRGGDPFTWTIGNDGNDGNYAINLPVGEYEIYATARGYSDGASKHVTVLQGSENTIDFDDVRSPGNIRILVSDQQSGKALDARISIEEGQKPLIGYFGKDVYFTELDRVGELNETIPPGTYLLQVSAGGGFTSLPQLIDVDIESGQTHIEDVEIAITAKPQAQGWYNADLHHHSDVLDGFTDAEFVLRSELAAGVDIAFLSDHDSVVNNEEMRVLSDARGLLFIPGTELSPSWAHFNAYPLDDGKHVAIDTGQATVQEVFAEARRMGADVIALNHPYSEYGYFESLGNNVAPGGFDASFDLVEIERNYYDDRNKKTLKRVWQMWNEGHKAYLAGGSDVHDVWNFESGAARSYAHVDGDLSVENFVAALKSGQSFVSQGPLVYPQILFGSEVDHLPGDELALKYSVQAVSGLRSVQLIERGRAIEVLMLDGERELLAIEFAVSPEADTWYSLVIEDKNGKFAYTNPVWVMVAK